MGRCVLIGLLFSFCACGGGYSPSSRVNIWDKQNNNQKCELPFTRNYSGGSPIVTVSLNGCVISDFIWDTGAEMTSISVLEFLNLQKNGKISKNDYVRTMRFGDATGGVSENEVYRIKEVTIPCKDGKELKCYDVEIAVSENPEAPMLLGQNVMRKLPKCSVNDLNEVIVFE